MHSIFTLASYDSERVVRKSKYVGCTFIVKVRFRNFSYENSKCKDESLPLAP